MPGLPRLPDRWRWRLLARLRGPVAASRALGVTVGDGCRILSMNVSSEYELVSIGDRVTVSSEVLFITHDGTGWLIRDEKGRRHYSYARIAIGNDVFIVEGLDLTKAAPGDYLFVVLPLKVEGADGSPARAVLLS